MVIDKLPPGCTRTSVRAAPPRMRRTASRAVCSSVMVLRSGTVEATVRPSGSGAMRHGVGHGHRALLYPTQGIHTIEGMPRKQDSDELGERDLAYRIAQAVYDRRTELGWSQRQLAEAAGMRQPHVSRLEAARSLPSLDVLRRVAEALGTDLTVCLVPREADHVPHDPPLRKTVEEISR